MKIKYIIPNLFTTASLISAMLALIFASDSNFQVSCWMIIASLFLDGMDGNVARLLKASSRFGAEWDTLSDFVAFGVTPAFIAYKAFLYTLGNWGLAIMILYVLCGGLRLVRFNLKNLDLTSKKNFEGLPIPAGAGVIITGMLIQYYFWDQLNYSIVLMILMPIVSFLMISKIEYQAIDKSTKPFSSLFFMIPFMVIITALAMNFPAITFFSIVYIYLITGFVTGLIKQIKKKIKD